jgi:deoxyadenosine/deoxycytidine kinase
MFLIEGNIGSGKTTLLKKIEKELPFLNVVFEPVNQWNNCTTGQSLLDNFYKNPNRWAYALETFAMACRIKEYLNESRIDQNKIMERSIFSGHYCFAKNDYLSGYINTMEWEIYKSWFYFLINQKIKSPQGFIYLKTDPEIALERIKARSRSGENSITLNYLKEIDKRHDEFLIEKKDLSKNLKNVPVLTLDCNFDFENNRKKESEILDKVNNFIKNINKNNPDFKYDNLSKCSII